MAFFDPLPEPEPDAEERPYVAWPHEPPVNLFPVELPAVVVLARTATAAVYATGFEVFPQGLFIRVVTLLEPAEAMRAARAGEPRGHHGGLRFGVLLGGGTKVVAAGWQPDWTEGYHLVEAGGGGNEVRQRHEFWLWPLPPPGSVELVCSWPEHGIDEAHGVLEAGDLAELTAGAIELWPVGQAPEGEAQGWFMYAPLQQVMFAPPAQAGPGQEAAPEQAGPGQEAAGQPPRPAAARPSGRRRATFSPTDTTELSAVAARPCPDCGFDSAEPSFAEIPRRLWAAVAIWARALDQADATRPRPQLEVWSLAEHASAIRDVCRVYADRLQLMLTQDDPQFPGLTPDERALTFHVSDPDAVGRELMEAAENIVGLLEAVRPDQIGRTGRRSNGERFTVDSLARYVLHDVVHHSRAAGLM